MSEDKQGLVPLEEIRDTVFAVNVKGLRRLTFEPNPDHGGRHIEWVPEPVAQDLLRRFNNRFQRLAIAQNLEPVAAAPEVEPEQEVETETEAEAVDQPKHKRKKTKTEE